MSLIKKIKSIPPEQRGDYLLSCETLKDREDTPLYRVSLINDKENEIVDDFDYYDASDMEADVQLADELGVAEI